MPGWAAKPEVVALLNEDEQEKFFRSLQLAPTQAAKVHTSKLEENLGLQATAKASAQTAVREAQQPRQRQPVQQPKEEEAVSKKALRRALQNLRRMCEGCGSTVRADHALGRDHCFCGGRLSEPTAPHGKHPNRRDSKATAALEVLQRYEAERAEAETPEGLRAAAAALRLQATAADAKATWQEAGEAWQAAETAAQEALRAAPPPALRPPRAARGDAVTPTDLRGGATRRSGGPSERKTRS